MRIARNIEHIIYPNKKCNTLKEFADFINTTFDYRPFMQYDCDYYFDDENSCCSKNCCHCGKFANIKIEIIEYYKILNIISNLSIIDQYCIDRILSYYEFNNTFNYEPIIENSYYGEELSAIVLNQDIIYNIYKNISCLDNLSDFDKIVYILDMEYDIPATFLKDLSNVSVQTISTYDIIFPLGLRKIYQNYQDYNLPRAISKKNKDHTYSIIDGYKRINAAIQNDIKEIQVILLS